MQMDCGGRWRSLVPSGRCSGLSWCSGRRTAAAELKAAEELREEDEDEEIRETGDRLVQAGAFTFLSAFSFMIFNLLCAPCFAAMGAIKREMNNAKWTAAAIGYMCVFAYAISLIVFQLGGLITGEASFGLGTIAALIVLAAILYLLFRKGCQPSQEKA